jgi:hypothetical protein
VSAEQAEKKHGERIVNQGDGFASVAFDSGRKQLVPGFTNRKDVASLESVALLSVAARRTNELLRLFAAACKCRHSA